MKLGITVKNTNLDLEGSPDIVMVYFVKLRGGKLVQGFGGDGLRNVLRELGTDEQRALLAGELDASGAALVEFIQSTWTTWARADFEIHEDGGLIILVDGVADELLEFTSSEDLRQFLLDDGDDEVDEPTPTNPRPSES